MDIAIPGPGCPKCRQTVEIVRQAVEQTGVRAAIWPGGRRSGR